jgi:hypothetical protein
MAEYLGPDWPGRVPVFRLRRVRRIGEKLETEVVLGITSRSRERAGAKERLGRTRGHRVIENGLHGVRDGTRREDASRVRKGTATETMAILRNLVIFLFKSRVTAFLSTSTRNMTIMGNIEGSLEVFAVLHDCLPCEMSLSRESAAIHRRLSRHGMRARSRDEDLAGIVVR